MDACRVTTSSQKVLDKLARKDRRRAERWPIKNECWKQLGSMVICRHQPLLFTRIGVSVINRFSFCAVTICSRAGADAELEWLLLTGFEALLEATLEAESAERGVKLRSGALRSAD